MGGLEKVDWLAGFKQYAFKVMVNLPPYEAAKCGGSALMVYPTVLIVLTDREQYRIIYKTSIN